MNFYKNQEILITGKFIGIADNGKIQVKIKGINDVQFDIDANYISAAGRSPRSPIESNTKSITQPEPVEAQPDPEPEYEVVPEPEPEPEAEPEPQDDFKVAADEQPQQMTNDGMDDAVMAAPENPNEKFHPKHKFKSMARFLSFIACFPLYISNRC